LIAQNFLAQQICQKQPPNLYANKPYKPLKPWMPQGYPGSIFSTPMTANWSSTKSTRCQASRPFPCTHKCGNAPALNTHNCSTPYGSGPNSRQLPHTLRAHRPLFWYNGFG